MREGVCHYVGRESVTMWEGIRLLGDSSLDQLLILLYLLLVSESDAMKNAKQALSATRKATTKVIKAVGSAVDSTLETPLVKGTGKILYKTAETVADVSQKVAHTF